VDGRSTFIKDRRLLLALGLSGLLHLIGMYMYSQHEFFVLMDDEDKQREKSIAFEIVETPERSRTHEIVETPEYSRTETPPENAELASDKNTRAQDMEDSKLEDEGLPFSEGLFDVRSVYENRLAGVIGDPAEEPGMEQKELPESGDLNSSQRNTEHGSSKFSRELLLGKDQPGSSTNQNLYKQRKLSAEDVGGISFNTYAWDYAPYLLELKRRIERNIYPPPAFTHLGFGGSNVVRFRIFPKGHLEGPEVLGYNGEKALIETSKRAVQVSAPFPPLPEDFPEKYLEVTASFHYHTMRKR